jgi:hypothetical protein
MAAFMALYLGSGWAEKRGRSVTAVQGRRKKKSYRQAGLIGFTAPGRRLSTKSVDKCVDDWLPLLIQSLQKYDIVKLVKFSPGYFSLIRQ